mmetsp:Transcript_40/g.61  ORF Transcript_40/g.61 Transcript_40/m.61 type:complete len:922 (+) Transcript_40:73-2838(+)
MGISISIENDANYPVKAEIRIVTGSLLAKRTLKPKEVWKKTDGGLAASSYYWLYIRDDAFLEGTEETVYRLRVRAPAKIGTRKVKVSEIIAQGKVKIAREKLSRKNYIQAMWEELDDDKSGELTRNEMADWVHNEVYVSTGAFQGKNPTKLVKEIFDAMDIDQNGFVTKKEFSKYFQGMKKEDLAQLGYTIVDYQRARLLAACVPFFKILEPGKEVIETKYLRRWFSGNVKDPRAKYLLKKKSEELKKIKGKKNLTFWEWMNFVAPAEIDAKVKKIEEIRNIRILGLEVDKVRPNLDNATIAHMAPRMNIVMMICGSRGDVQPFIPIGQRLVAMGHRVRIATHANFRDFVTKNGLEFYPLGGDPKKLMAYMVKTKGQIFPSGAELLSPSYWESTKKRKEMMEDIVMSCWDAANKPDEKGENKTPFVADVIISNPTTYSHVHLAEAMSIPMHMFFTMPWSPTSQFPHPLGGVAYEELAEKKSATDEVDKGFLDDFKAMKGKKTKHSLMDSNVASYRYVDILMHIGLGDIIRKFRKKHGLPEKWKEGSDIINAREVPFAYIWSPSLIPKPSDWGEKIDIVGFCELKGSGFSKPPPKDIASWIDKDPNKKPIFIGFGSCVLPDTKLAAEVIYNAAKKADIRVIIQQGWAGLGASLYGKEGVSFVKGAKISDEKLVEDELDINAEDFCLVIGRVAHSWLFNKVAGVCHHGGAGTTYAGLIAARPTFISPFFGDQPFWGQMVNNAGAGPRPTPVEKWNVTQLSEDLKSMFSSKQQAAAETLSKSMKAENGAFNSVSALYGHLPFHQMKCDLFLSDTARYYVPNWKLRLGDRALFFMRTCQPTWFTRMMGNVHRYKSCDWTFSCTASYEKEPMTHLPSFKPKLTDSDKEVAGRNLKAILLGRGKEEQEKPSTKSNLRLVHPEPRQRL